MEKPELTPEEIRDLTKVLKTFLEGSTTVSQYGRLLAKLEEISAWCKEEKARKDNDYSFLDQQEDWWVDVDG